MLKQKVSVLPFDLLLHVFTSGSTSKRNHRNWGQFLDYLWSSSSLSCQGGIRRLGQQMVEKERGAGKGAGRGGPGAVAGGGGAGRNRSWSAVAMEREGAVRCCGGRAATIASAGQG
ncbi:hypothetical protein CRG98_011399 [Punica granatum]|uniref:Uncharacterized protein n=1 Tax=Punica granatum TaxID=22663 RepID=A0A2I0KIQ1_PUNGR|nr:hypothetical protein CRG98_011399 [Punica granatum]